MGARELGSPMGNPLALPNKRGGVSAIYPTIVDFTGIDGGTIISGTYLLPAGYSFFRVTVVGGGGSGLPANGSTSAGGGGGGGGLARSAILPVVVGTSIAWQAGNPSTGTANGQDSTASFGSISLLATGGKTPTGAAGGAGGVGSGGLDNWTGGSGGSNGSGSTAGSGGGGGAAGVDGNGGNGGNGRRTGQSSGCTGGGGGGGGINTAVANFSGGGGGVGASGAIGNITAPSPSYNPGSSTPYFGTPGDPLTGRGGNWGGGGGSNYQTGNGWGGFGGVRIELW